MDAQLLARNLADCPLIPRQYRAQLVIALGGKVNINEPTSKQGGMTISGMQWENGIYTIDPTQMDELLAYCVRNEIFYVICPAIKRAEQISVYVQSPLAENSERIVGRTIEGTLAAALVLLQRKDNDDA